MTQEKKIQEALYLTNKGEKEQGHIWLCTYLQTVAVEVLELLDDYGEVLYPAENKHVVDSPNPNRGGIFVITILENVTSTCERTVIKIRT